MEVTKTNKLSLIVLCGLALLAGVVAAMVYTNYNQQIKYTIQGPPANVAFNSTPFALGTLALNTSYTFVTSPGAVTANYPGTLTIGFNATAAPSPLTFQYFNVQIYNLTGATNVQGAMFNMTNPSTTFKTGTDSYAYIITLKTLATASYNESKTIMINVAFLQH
jgi:hypothetical protein